MQETAVVLDDAEAYFMNFEDESTPTEAGGTHIGHFLGWAMIRGLASAEMATRLPQLLSREKTGRDLLFDHCDGKLMDSDLSERGSAFAEHYCGAPYLTDYLRMFGQKDDRFDRLANVPDDWRTQQSVIERLDRRYSEWRMSQGMPSKQALHDALLATTAPVLEAAGFVLEPAPSCDADAVRSTFVNKTAWQTPRVSVFGAASPEQFYGIGIEVTFNIPRLYDKALAEDQIDRARWSMSEQSTARLSMSAIADGWAGPKNLWAYYPSLWIFEESELVPAAEFLADRLREFALPALARVTSIRTLCEALDTRPLTASPFFMGWMGYTIPLLFEMCLHPSLPAVLAEMEAFWQAQPPEAWGTLEMRAFLARVRERNSRR
jgi:hypothetical protein